MTPRVSLPDQRPNRLNALAGVLGRAKGSWSSIAAAMLAINAASLALWVNRLTQSRLLQAGTTPDVEMRPRVSLLPVSRLKAAGIRPEPAVSVPKAKLTKPQAMAMALPELEPPGMSVGVLGLKGSHRVIERLPNQLQTDLNLFCLLAPRPLQRVVLLRRLRSLLCRQMLGTLR